MGGLFTHTVPHTLILPMLGAMTATISSSPAKQDAQRQEGDPAVLKKPRTERQCILLKKRPKNFGIGWAIQSKSELTVTINYSDKGLLPALPVVLARAS